MKATLTYKDQDYAIDLSKPLDISIPIVAAIDTVNAWYIAPPKIEPVTEGDWIGKVSAGGTTNFNTITFNPHSHGTHTECVGHITPEFHSITRALTQFFFMAKVITIAPEQQGEDQVITKAMLQKEIAQDTPEALLIRTLPNTAIKKNQQYSHTNWAYLTEEAAIYIREIGVEHLLIDLPSVDKEKDGGQLVAHKAFWNYPEATRHQATITEMIYVKETISDGMYILNLQVAAFQNDAAPSRPILYKIQA